MSSHPMFFYTLFTVVSTAVLYVDPDWEYIDFLNAASHRLEMVPTAKRVFNANGT